MKKSCIAPFLTTVLVTACAFGQNVSPTINDVPSRQFGQPANAPAFTQPLTTASPNLIEGRELSNPFAVAFDTSVTPPILYVVDTYNHRVLAFKNPSNLSVCGINASTCGFADKVIGQRDLNSTLQGGPGRQGLSTGFAYPTSVAVDASGNLYVLDSGNNRILRFPAPFKQTVSPPLTDLVIGQKTVNQGVSANQGQSQPDATTLSFPVAGPVSIAIDPSGNLWVSDYNNNRALRFPVSVLAPNTILPQADLALGQVALNSAALPAQCASQAPLFKGCLNQPRGLAFDSSGNLYVADTYGRVLYFTAPFQGSGQSASRILGICEAIAPQTSQTCSVANGYGLGNPTGIFTDGSHLFVADAANHRVAMYDAPGAWPAPPNAGVTPQTVQDSPPIKAIIGQVNATSGKPNKGQAEADATTLALPLGGALNGTDLWVADSGNNRVLSFPLQGGSYSTATRLVGQVDFPYSQPNLIEGREVFVSLGSNSVGGGVAVDHSSNPPHLYVADTYNNRILGFLDARKVTPGKRADIVIGQNDLPGQPGSAFFRALVNNPRNDNVAQPTGLSAPSGITVDTAGNLWVADSGNARVLRFPAPFANSTQVPNLVLGQQDFVSNNTDATQAGMRFSYGLALFSNDRALAVSDPLLNRILVFKKPAGGDYKSGAPADIVLGQSNFISTTPSNSNSGLNLPRHMGVDSSDRLYVADSNNNRLVVFTNVLTSPNGNQSSLQLNNMSLPQGVVVSQTTGESWVTLGNQTIWRLPEYGALSLLSNPNAPPYTQQLILQSVPFAIAFDNSNNLIVAEQANRVTFYFPKLTYTHAANYNGGDANGGYHQGLAPGQLALLYQVGQDFHFQTNTENSDPWPPTMSDLQVTVNGTVAPIFRVDLTDIAFQVPSSTPPSGTADFLVTHPSTGEIVAAGSIPMAQYNPGFFTIPATGSGQIAALNGDNFSVNSITNPISRDGNHFIVLYLTGGGVFDGGNGSPIVDGFAPAPGQAPFTHDRPQMLGNDFGVNGFAPDNLLTYSGAGAFAGGWQINFTVPNTLLPGAHQLVVQIGGYSSNVGPGGGKLLTVFYTK